VSAIHEELFGKSQKYDKNMKILLINNFWKLAYRSDTWMDFGVRGLKRRKTRTHKSAFWGLEHKD